MLKDLSPFISGFGEYKICESVYGSEVMIVAFPSPSVGCEIMERKKLSPSGSLSKEDMASYQSSS